MRLRLAWIFPIGRHRGNALFTRGPSAVYPNSFEAIRRLFSSFYAARTTTAPEHKWRWPSVIRFQQQREFGSLLLLQPVCIPVLTSVRELHQRGLGRRKWKRSVEMSEENWKFLVESGERSRYEKIFRVEIDDRLMSTDNKRLIVIGSEKAVNEVVGLLQRAPNEVEAVREKITIRKVELLDGVARWMTSKSPNGKPRNANVCERTGARIRLSDDFRHAYITGSREEIDAALAILDGLYVRPLKVPWPVTNWFCNKSTGSERARTLELQNKFDTSIQIGPMPDDDPACFVDVVAVGALEENVQEVLKTIDSVVVEEVGLSALQVEFWFGHEEEQEHRRPVHLLEERTDSSILLDAVHGKDGLLRIVGMPDGARTAVEEINKTQYIALRTSVVSFAMSNYLKRARRPYENDDRQIHLAYNDTRPGTWELRRLYVVARQGDDAEAGKADDDIMRILDLDETVLDVPMWAQFLVDQCREMEKSTVTGMGLSDAIKRRAIVDIAGSTSTVKEGMKEVIRRIEAHDQYKKGDICLRRIEGQSVDTAGFKKIGDAKPLDLSRCKEPFSWERLTQERWRYVGGPRDDRPPKRPRRQSV